MDVFEDFSSNAIICLDASALLHSYRLAPEASEAWLAVLEQLQDRVWIPEQAAWEYQRNRLSAVSAHESVLAKVRREVDDALEKLRDALKKLAPSLERSRVLRADDLLRIIPEAEELLKKPLAVAAQQVVDHQDAVKGLDTIDQRLSAVTDGRIGESYEDDRLKQIYDEGKKRFANKVPPGWKDEGKEADRQRYGDLLIWYQIMDHAREVGRPAIFVTEDDKEDWWYEPAGRRFGPHPEMREEFYACTGNHMWIYNVVSFLKQAERFGAEAVGEGALTTAADYEDLPDSDREETVAHRRRRMLTALVEAVELLESEDAQTVEGRDDVVAKLMALLDDELS